MSKVLVQTRVSALNVDALNRSGVCESDLENGDVLVCGGQSDAATQPHVFKVSKPTGVAKNLWMAYEPEVVATISGQNVYRGIDADVRNFKIKAGEPFRMFKPVAGVDLIQISKDFFEENYDPDSVEDAAYVEITSSGKFRAVDEPTSNFAGMQWKIFSKEPIIIANGKIAGEGVDAWILECTNN